MSKLELIKKEFKKRGFRFEKETDESFDFLSNDCNCKGSVNIKGENISYSTIYVWGREECNIIQWNNGEVVAIVDYILG